MKKKVFLFGIVFLVLMIPIIFAATDTTSSDDQKVEKARDCLANKTEKKGCNNLVVEEKVFSSLAIGACQEELFDSSRGGKCWPESGCTIKATAQAILALDKAGKNTDDAQAWLLSQKTSPSDLIWYLQIESPEETKCTISYSGGEYVVTVGKDKQVSAGAGNCLSLSEGKWWLKIAPSCYGEEIEVSCDKQFLTNLLFRKQDSSTIHVSEKTTESSANGLNVEQVNSFCFGQNQKCDYEGSLWAAMVLDYTNNDVDSYMPYLITFSEDSANDKFLPESFLYYLTNSGDFRNNLLLKQKVSKYWEESGDRFYDTALALLPIQDEPQEKVNSKKWLLDNKTMDSEGCWKGSISITGFILYSLWPTFNDNEICTDGDSRDCTIGDCEGTQECVGGTWGTCIKTDPDCSDNCIDGDSRDCTIGGCEGTQECVGEIWGACIKTDLACEGGEGELSCEDNYGFCLSSVACAEAGGIRLGYSCPGMAVCCSEQELLESCFSQGGEICISGEECSGGIESNALDLNLGEICCVGGGICAIPISASDCELAGGSCKNFCSDQEETIDQMCNSYADDCCVIKGTAGGGDNPPKSSYLWIWILGFLILIVLVVIGYLYKDKLKAYWIAYRGGGKHSPPGRGGPFLPPASPPFFSRGIPPRRIIPLSNTPPTRAMPVKKPTGEMEEVLRKLKEMGK